MRNSGLKNSDLMILTGTSGDLKYLFLAVNNTYIYTHLMETIFLPRLKVKELYF